MLGLFRKKRPKPEVDESRIDLNIRKELEKTFIKRHVMNEKAVNAIVNIFRKYPQEIIIFDIIDMKSRKFNEIEVKKLSYIESINYPGSFLIIYNSEYQPLIYWQVLSGNIYIHPQFNEIEIVEDNFKLTENYYWDMLREDAKSSLYFVDTPLRGYKTIEWSLEYDALEFEEIIETFNVTGIMFESGSDNMEAILEQFNIKYELDNHFVIINHKVRAEFLKKIYNEIFNHGDHGGLLIFVDMMEPITKEMISDNRVVINNNKVIIPVNDIDDSIYFFNF